MKNYNQRTERPCQKSSFYCCNLTCSWLVLTFSLWEKYKYKYKKYKAAEKEPSALVQSVKEKFFSCADAQTNRAMFGEINQQMADL